MGHGAPHAVGHEVEPAGLGGAVGVGPPRLDLLGREERGRAELVIADEVAGAQVGTALERDYPEAGSGELLDHHAPAGSGADHTDIELLALGYDTPPS